MKFCQGCGAVIPVPVDLRPSRWAAQRFCSSACAGRTLVKAPEHLCVVDTCVNQARGNSEWCNLHRQRVRKHGDPLHERWPDLLTRVMQSIRKGDCWVWQKSLFDTGYGQIKVGTRNRLAHRLVYELLVGPIPVGLELDHLCRNRACVNPAHLEPVTTKENIRRGHASRALLRKGSNG